ncbi:MAG: PEGA domain-containing protein [Methanoregula sp.]
MMERDSFFLAGVFILMLVIVFPVSAANSIAVDAGDDQSATVNTEVDTPPVVIVKDSDGKPIAGISVTFEVTEGEGTVSPASVTTDDDGVATVTSWTLGETAGLNELTVSANPVNDTASLTITATGTAGEAATISKNGGDNQEATVGTVVATPPSVKVMDEFDNPVSGATVIFSAEPASSLVGGSSQTTGSGGIATVGSWTLGTVTGTNHLTATTGSHSVTFSAEATASTAAPTISTISPATGLNTGTISGVTITGTHFSAIGGSVILTKSGEENITGTCSRGITSITCSFDLSEKEDGSWYVVVENEDGQYVKKSSGFTIYSESGSDVTITSISPATARAGDDIDFTITGKNFITTMVYGIYLFNSDYENITADDIEVKSTTSIKGSFNLDDDAEVDTYQLCIRNEFGGIECEKKAFTITTNKEGTIEIESSPSGATIYIDNIANGTTPGDIDILVGSYRVTLKKAGYQDYSKLVSVDEDDTVTIDAKLYAAATTTATSRPSTPLPTAVPTTRSTTIKSTIKIPTTLVVEDTPTTAEEAPVEPVLIVGSICLALIAFRKH